MTTTLSKWDKAARVAMVLVLIALIRHIGEVFRLNYYSETGVTFSQIQPFLIGAVICAVATLIAVILHFYKYPKLIVATEVLCIVLLLIVKAVYL